MARGQNVAGLSLRSTAHQTIYTHPRTSYMCNGGGADGVNVCTSSAAWLECSVMQMHGLYVTPDLRCVSLPLRYTICSSMYYIFVCVRCYVQHNKPHAQTFTHEHPERKSQRQANIRARLSSASKYLPRRRISVHFAVNVEVLAPERADYDKLISHTKWCICRITKTRERGGE